MKNLEGETVFCPGCPVTGNFVGPVDEESVQITEHGSYAGLDTIKGLVFHDADGLASEAVQIGGATDSGKKTAEALDASREVIIRRIGNCVGKFSRVHGSHMHTGEEINCPAINDTVIKALFKADEASERSA